MKPVRSVTERLGIVVGAARRRVLSAEGRHLGVLRMPEIAGNLNWGGRDWNDLYCACSTSIYRVRMKVRGSPVAYMRMA